MSESSPMRGKRVQKIRCSVEGHAQCEVVRFAGPRGRTTEKRDWITEAIEDARERAEQLPPDIRDAALRSGTRSTKDE